MLKKAVKLLRGSVCVRAKSAYPERMLNLCSARGIEFWDVRWIDDTALSFCVARGDLHLSYMQIEYYTLIAMACMYGGMLGLTAINNQLANMSAKGKRVSVSPNKKAKVRH